MYSNVKLPSTSSKKSPTFKLKGLDAPFICLYLPFFTPRRSSLSPGTIFRSRSCPNSTRARPREPFYIPSVIVWADDNFHVRSSDRVRKQTRWFSLALFVSGTETWLMFCALLVIVACRLLPLSFMSLSSFLPGLFQPTLNIQYFKFLLLT